MVFMVFIYVMFLWMTVCWGSDLFTGIQISVHAVSRRRFGAFLRIPCSSGGHDQLNEHLKWALKRNRGPPKGNCWPHKRKQWSCRPLLIDRNQGGNCRWLELLRRVRLRPLFCKDGLSNLYEGSICVKRLDMATGDGAWSLAWLKGVLAKECWGFAMSPPQASPTQTFRWKCVKNILR